MGLVNYRGRDGRMKPSASCITMLNVREGRWEDVIITGETTLTRTRLLGEMHCIDRQEGFSWWLWELEHGVRGGKKSLQGTSALQGTSGCGTSWRETASKEFVWSLPYYTLAVRPAGMKRGKGDLPCAGHSNHEEGILEGFYRCHEKWGQLVDRDVESWIKEVFKKHAKARQEYIASLRGL
jgi:hypothetical protein